MTLGGSQSEEDRERDLVVQLLEFRRWGEVVSDGVSSENDVGITVAIMREIATEVGRREEDNSPRIRQDITILLKSNVNQKGGRKITTENSSTACLDA